MTPRMLQTFLFGLLAFTVIFVMCSGTACGWERWRTGSSSSSCAFWIRRETCQPSRIPQDICSRLRRDFRAMLVYLASLVIRFRNLHQDEEMLKEIEVKKGEEEDLISRRDLVSRGDAGARRRFRIDFGQAGRSPKGQALCERREVLSRGRARIS